MPFCARLCALFVVPLVVLLASVQPAVASPHAFIAPERVLPDRPSSATAQASPEVLAGAEALVAPTSWFTPVVFGVLALTIVGTLVSIWMTGRTSGAGGLFGGFRWTLGAKMSMAFGLVGIVSVASLAAWRTTGDMRSDVAHEVLPLRNISDTLEAVDREGLRARIHARGFLVFELDKHVDLFLDAVVPAGEYLARAKELATNDDETHARVVELEVVLADYVNVIVNAVRLTDTRRAILEQQINPTHEWIDAELVGDDHMRTLLSDAHTVAYSATFDDDQEQAERASAMLTDLLAQADEDQASRIEPAVAFYRARLDELAQVAGERQYWIRSQCPPTGMRLGELSTSLSNDLRARARDLERQGVVAASMTSKWASIGVLVLLGLGAMVVWSITQSVSKRSKNVANALTTAAEGNLSAMQLDTGGKDDLSVSARAANKLRSAFADLVADSRETSQTILTLSKELDDSAQHLSSSVGR